jgi:hypothetical protein
MGEHSALGSTPYLGEDATGYAHAVKIEALAQLGEMLKSMEKNRVEEKKALDERERMRFQKRTTLFPITQHRNPSPAPMRAMSVRLYPTLSISS